MICAQEIKEIMLGISNWSSLDLTIVTGEVDFKKVWELARLVRNLEDK